MLEAKNLRKKYAALTVLDDLSLTVPKGSTTVLLGPSGCGKSTLLRIMIGLEHADSGTVSFNGQLIDGANLAKIRQQIGYVIQSGGLFPHLTAFDNVALLARHLKQPEAEISKRINELCELVHLAPERLQQFPQALSGGQRQRVSLMRALMLDPPLILMDEPLGALDPMIRARLQEDLKAIFEKLQKTVVMVTHDLAEAGYFGHSVVLLKDGKIEQQGAFKELLEQPKTEFVTQFVDAQRSVHFN